MSRAIRVLVVDDSALMRKLIPQILSRDLGIEVVGTAMDGTFVLKKIEELKPDVITLDLKMPNMDGIETLGEIMRVHPLPVIVVSAHSQQGASGALRALSLGAFDFVAKPVDARSGNLDDIATALAERIRAAAHANISKAPREFHITQRPRKAAPSQNVHPTKVVAIGISTGGPNALQLLFSELPPDFPATILVVQHMPEGFTEMFARRLDESSSIQVKEAQIQRPAPRRPRADLSRQPPHESPPHASRRCRGARRVQARERPSPFGGRSLPFGARTCSAATPSAC